MLPSGESQYMSSNLVVYVHISVFLWHCYHIWPCNWVCRVYSPSTYVPGREVLPCHAPLCPPHHAVAVMWQTGSRWCKGLSGTARDRFLIWLMVTLLSLSWVYLLEKKYSPVTILGIDVWPLLFSLVERAERHGGYQTSVPTPSTPNSVLLHIDQVWFYSRWMATSVPYTASNQCPSWCCNTLAMWWFSESS